MTGRRKTTGGIPGIGDVMTGEEMEMRGISGGRCGGVGNMRTRRQEPKGFARTKGQRPGERALPKADNDGVSLETRSRRSGLRLGIAENGAGTKTARIFPGTNCSGGVCRFAMFCDVSGTDYNVDFSTLLAVS